MWISKGSFLVLECDSFAGGEAKIKRVYLAKLGTTADVISLESLASAKGSVLVNQGKQFVTAAPGQALAQGRVGSAIADHQSRDPAAEFAQLGEMAADISADFSFNWVKITICIDGVNLEV